MWLEVAKAIDLFRLHVYIQIVYGVSGIQSSNHSDHRDMGLLQEKVSQSVMLCKACHVIVKFNTETPVNRCCK